MTSVTAGCTIRSRQRKSVLHLLVIDGQGHNQCCVGGDEVKKNRVSVLAIGYSGSNYLSLLVGSHSRAAHIGEVHYVRKWQKAKRDKVCAICNDSDLCPVFRGISRHNLSQVYDVIFSHVDPSIMTLVDNSKGIRWAKRFLNKSNYSTKYIHLIRDPRALIRRWMLTYTQWREALRIRVKVMRAYPMRSPSFLFAGTRDIYLYNWLVRNQKITHFIREHNLDAHLVTYRDLARDTPNELKRIMDWIGLPYEPTQLEYWNFEHHGTHKADYEWIKKEKVRHFDLRWQSFLSQDMISRIVGDSEINAYLNEIGLAFSDDGLTRIRHSVSA